MIANAPDIAAILRAEHADPFRFLGMHRTAEGGIVARVLAPDADGVAIIDAADAAQRFALEKLHPAGLFAAAIPERAHPFRYRLALTRNGASEIIDDPFRFGEIVSAHDVRLFKQGKLYRAFETFGAHPRVIDDVAGVAFVVWAPHAKRVSVLGDFNAWDNRAHPMRKRHEAGIWEIFIPALARGANYKFEVMAQDGMRTLKADPFAFAAELRPHTSSRIEGPAPPRAATPAQIEARRARNGQSAPISIYEVHAGSWRTRNGAWLSYSELADALIPYAQELGFTHVQFLPLTEFPFDGSWGYQPTGLFAATSRFGSAQDFAAMVARFDDAGIGVICDFVPAHFPIDAHGLARFDGAALFEHPDPRLGFHPDWNTLIYDFTKPQVVNFLISSALYWFDRFGIDGLRVDAVSSMLYLDYSRGPGQWLPNIYGGNINLEAVEFLRRLNETAYGGFPGIAMIAEESTAWPGVSKPTYDGGLGFGFKWNLGWMHDTLSYMGRDPIHRAYHHNDITFGLVYAFSEHFILPLSHDEVVHGKGSILARMPGDDWQRFANLRALYGLMWAHPGKKLLFMGAEFGQVSEWRHDGELDWHLLDHAPHAGVQRLIGTLNRLYRDLPALHEQDGSSSGFQWLQSDASAISAFAFVRWDKARAAPLVAAVNMTPLPRTTYRLGVPHAGEWRIVLDTHAEKYGAGDEAGAGSEGAIVRAEPNAHDGQPASVVVALPPLGALYLAPA
ncbi:MAG: 1,4-alpha-glucan branching protein GlgB [Caulobacterales bacterium]